MTANHVKKVVGLTGGIGAGKSVIALIISDLGIPVFDSDLVAREVLTGNPDVVKKITQEFGGEVLTNKHVPDRAKLAAVVFDDAEKLQKLNSIIHPAVGNAFATWINNTPAGIVVRESALLFETGIYTSSFKNILVTCPEDLRVQRVMKRSNMSADEVRNRIHHQMPENEKIKLADYIIVNDEQQPVLPQVWKVLQQLQA